MEIEGGRRADVATALSIRLDNSCKFTVRTHQVKSLFLGHSLHSVKLTPWAAPG